MSFNYIFTSSAPNYLPKVMCLARSVKKYLPKTKFVWLVADKVDLSIKDTSTYESCIDEVLTLDELQNWDNKWLFSYNLVELSTAIKPFAADRILNREDCKTLLYLDPDTVLFNGLAAVYDSLNNFDIVLTPHLSKPETSLIGVLENEISALKHGIFNLGFIGLRPSEESKKFANWWKERLTHFCQSDLSLGVFTDQKWINFVPVFFENVKILKDSAYNVAPWNISQRKLTGSFEDGFFVDDKRLEFYHFTGFDKGDHEFMAKRYAPGNKSVIDLIEWYKKSTITDRKLPKWNLGYYSDGVTAIKNSHREIYINRKDLQEAFPDPFEKSQNSFIHWLLSHGVNEYPNKTII